MSTTVSNHMSPHDILTLNVLGLRSYCANSTLSQVPVIKDLVNSLDCLYIPWVSEADSEAKREEALKLILDR